MRRTRRPLRLVLALTCLSLFGAACSDADQRDPGQASASSQRAGAGTGNELSTGLRLASALSTFNSCDALLDHLKTEAGERVGPYGLVGVGGGFGYRTGAEDAIALPSSAFNKDAPATTAAAATGAVESSAGGTPAYSTTNTVEAGIDEGDVVKTDGEHLYLIGQGGLSVVRTAAGSSERVGTLRLPGYATQLVKVGDTLLITGQPDGSETVSSAERTIMPTWNGASSALWQVDVSDPTKPTMRRQMVVDGSVLSIRMTGDVARVVVQSPPDGLDFVAPSTPGAEDRALQVNKDVIAESEIDDWLGGYRLLDADGDQISAGLLTPCASVSRPADFHGFTTTTVLSIDLADGLSEPNGAAVLADSQRVYASAESLYVAIGAWQDPFVVPILEDGGGSPTTVEDDDETTTAIHRFSFDGDDARYTASGEVIGSLMNDFSMSERDGVLRVATTAGPPWGAQDSSESYVTTLRADGDALAEVGRVGELGKGERIYGVRFIGTNAYVVTFRQTDPLYVVDLRDPAKPAVTGELKMNGYSGYLHPIGEDRLLGVGQDADADGRITGALVAVFDVSDPTAPTRTAAYTLPGAWLNTEWDYQSFLWWEPAQLAMMTGNFDTMGPMGNSGGVLGLDIGTSTITERGRILPSGGEPSGCPPVPTTIVQADGAPASSAPDCYWWAPPITRTVVVGSVVYSISDDAVQANDLNSFAALGRVSLS